MIQVKKIYAGLHHILLFIWYRFIGSIFRLMPVDESKVVVENFFGKGFGESPKYIVTEILKSPKKVKIIWLVKDRSDYEFPSGITSVRRGTFRELYHLATARVWLDNSRKHFGMKKRRGQFYMQTWHGAIGFKEVEANAGLDFWYQACAKNDSRMADVLISGCKWQTECYQSSFWYEGTIMETGRPENDFWNLTSVEKGTLKENVYRLFGFPDGARIVLYAPTFREGKNTDAYDMDYERLLRNLGKYWGGDWRILIRMHPNIENVGELLECSEKICNASSYPDIKHLILASELLITDYSSCLFDAFYINRAGIIYASDQEAYEKERGFAIPLTFTPAPVAESNDELEKIIREYSLVDYIQKCTDFSEKYGTHHYENASGCAAEWILDKME